MTLLTGAVGMAAVILLVYYIVILMRGDRT